MFTWRSGRNINALCTFSLGRASTGTSSVTLRNLNLPEISFSEITRINLREFRGLFANL